MKHRRKNKTGNVRSGLPTDANKETPKGRNVNIGVATDGDLFRACFAHGPIGFIVTDIEGRILEANAAYCAITGYTEAELCSMNFVQLEHSEDLARTTQELKALLAGEVTDFVIENRFIRKDGRIVCVQNNVSMICDASGRPAQVIRLTQDVTERARLFGAHQSKDRPSTEGSLRESEESYRELFENSKDIIYVHNMSGRYTSVNRAAERVSGYSREEIIGRPFWDFIAPEYVKSAREYLCKKLEEVGETSYEVDLLTKEGERIPVEVTSRIIYQEGVPMGVQGTARDIRERRQAQEALQTYSRRLLEAQETERQYLARELHDGIGQALTAIKINLHSIQDMCQTSTCRPRVEESVAIIDEAISQVRELSLNLRPTLLDDLGLAPALRWYVHQFAQRTGLKTELLSDIDSARLAWEVETACFRITQEALTNVARHAHATTAVVQLKRLPAGLRVTISDNGIGFDVKHVKRQVSALGLRSMTERARAAKGAVTIYSQSAVGTQVVALFRLDKQ